MLNILMRAALGIVFGGLGFYFISNLTEFQNTYLNSLMRSKKKSLLLQSVMLMEDAKLLLAQEAITRSMP